MKFVSCICPTYNRAPGYLHLLNETVSSFLRQTYPATHRELLILNDTPGQELLCNHPGIRIINLPDRFDSLGQKFNYAIERASGDVILPWEDDDISLPHRVEQAVGKLEGFDYWNPQQSWYLEGNALHHGHNHGVCHNGSAFTRKAFNEVAGYPHTSGAQDAMMDYALKASVSVNPDVLKSPDQWSYVYRWGSSNCHLSGSTNHEAFYQTVGKWPIEQGQYLIFPTWAQDYAMRCRIQAAQAMGMQVPCGSCPK